MSNAAVLFVYLTAAPPAFVLRRFLGWSAGPLLIVAATLPSFIWSIWGIAVGERVADPWFGYGAVLAFMFGLTFAGAGLYAAMWSD